MLANCCKAEVGKADDVGFRHRCGPSAHNSKHSLRDGTQGNLLLPKRDLIFSMIDYFFLVLIKVAFFE